jgi:hypothetical protein
MPSLSLGRCAASAARRHIFFSRHPAIVALFTPPEPDRKQCEQQLQSDTDICGQQPNNASKGICREDAMKRYAHCRKTGAVNEPYLFTVGRMPRR